MAAVLATASVALQGCGSDSEPCACAQDAAVEAVQDAPEASVAETGLTDAQAQEWRDFCSATFGVQAGLSEGCCTDTEKQTDVYKTAQAILDGYALECRNSLLESAGLGRIVLEPAAAAQCAKAVQDAHAAFGCQMLWTFVDWPTSGCRGAVRGRQPEGAACRFRYECEDGLTCAGYMPAADGVCVIPEDGGTCREEEANLITRDVLDSLWGNHPACAPGYTCVHTLQANGFCDPAAAEGGPCAYDLQCTAGLRCIMATCGPLGPASQGSPCLLNTDCAQRLWCDQGVCHPRTPAGGACDTAIDSCSGFCLSGDGGTAGTCVEFCGSG